jgi:hypothetical protein
VLRGVQVEGVEHQHPQQRRQHDDQELPVGQRLGAEAEVVGGDQRDDHAGRVRRGQSGRDAAVAAQRAAAPRLPRGRAARRRPGAVAGRLVDADEPELLGLAWPALGIRPLCGAVRLGANLVNVVYV